MSYITIVHSLWVEHKLKAYNSRSMLGLPTKLGGSPLGSMICEKYLNLNIAILISRSTQYEWTTVTILQLDTWLMFKPNSNITGSHPEQLEENDLYTCKLFRITLWADSCLELQYKLTVV